MFTCASCTVWACKSGDFDKMPKNCPMQNREQYEEILAEYHLPENNDFFVKSSQLESDGYCEWNRVREIIEMCKRMHYEKVGLAFCVGFKKEARIFADLMRANGINLSSVICKNGGYDKTEFGIPDENKLKPGNYEACCNPVAQAKLLAEEGVEFIIVLGLCVGHDSIFFKYAAKYTDAPITILAVKDRVTGHNPCAALYCADGYFRTKFNDDKK